MTRRPLLVALVLLVVSFAVLARTHAAQDAKLPVTVFVLRHAETESSTAGNSDPALSAAGRERATSLVRLLAKSGVTHVYSSEYVRTQATVAGLAEAAELEPVIVSARKTSEQLELLRALPAGSVAVVAGHSNTVPALVAGLGGAAKELEEHPQYGPVLDHDSYDRLFAVVLPVSETVATKTIELRYGK